MRRTSRFQAQLHSLSTLLWVGGSGGILSLAKVHFATYVAIVIFTNKAGTVMMEVVTVEAAETVPPV